ncbi:ATP-binding protein [Psychromonas sp. MME2]|uniref:ATP-binding protein n=1 Tax=unclassified Psychromonas TaxID=2614957 RepID=UPI00339CABA7
MRWNSFNSLFTKIFVGFWLLILLLATVLVLLPKLDGRQLQDLSSSDLALLQRQQQHIQAFLAKRPLQQINVFFKMPPHNRFKKIYVTDSSGQLLNNHAPKNVRQFILDSSSIDTPKKRIFKHNTFFGPILIQHKQQDFLFYFSHPNDKESLQFVEWLIDNPLLLLLTALLISTPLCAYLSWHVTQPLRQLQNVANKVALGDIKTDFPIIKNSDEINQLAKSMQKMLLSVQDMLNNQQRLLSDISHELRSPLTRLNLALAISRKHLGDSKELQRISIEAERIELMIAEMLNLSRMQLNPHIKEEVAFNELLEEIFLDAQFEAKENGKIFISPEIEEIYINIYPELAYRAIENVIRNAIKYAKINIVVEITVTTTYILLSIKNDGPLIPENALQDIFRPFYRLNDARDRESGGVGLGLSITENAMSMHGGKIWAENIDKQVCMHLQFPRFP